MLIMAKNQKVLMVIKGMGRQVKKTVTSRKSFLPQTSERAPTKGALRKERMPLMPMIRPFIRNVWSGKVLLRTDMMGIVSRPHAKNSRKMTTSAWYRLGMPMPEV